MLLLTGIVTLLQDRMIRTSDGDIMGSDAGHVPFIENKPELEKAIIDVTVEISFCKVYASVFSYNLSINNPAFQLCLTKLGDLIRLPVCRLPS